MQPEFGVHIPIYMNWKTCMQKQKQFRIKLSLPENKKEDEKMCRYAFRLHFSNHLKELKNNCCQGTEDDDY